MLMLIPTDFRSAVWLTAIKISRPTSEACRGAPEYR